MATTVIFKDNLDEVMSLFETTTSRILADMGIVIRADVVENSPARTGALRRSWQVEVDDNERCVFIGVPYNALKGNYAKYVELGTTKQRPQHMLSRAVEGRKNQLEDIAKTHLKNA